MEMEREGSIMIVTHQAVIRCIYAYFMNIKQEKSPWVAIPLHTVIKLTPGAYGTEMVAYVLPYFAVLNFVNVLSGIPRTSPQYPHSVLNTVPRKWENLRTRQHKMRQC